ncbi:hypothetical protein Y695_04586 [Hydrogenophaga sp. T4]|nr:hypothetical protein Y695_04586 [Hydrogenophaga sp. T4]
MCQKNMLVTVSTASSRQCTRSMRNGTLRHTRNKPSTGRPSHMQMLRKLSGGKPVTPIFMIGQLRPQTRVSRTSRMSCWRDRACIGLILGGFSMAACRLVPP